MTEENTAPAVEDIDPLSEDAFDLFSLIEEDYGFPESEVEVYLNEKAAHDRTTRIRKIAKLDRENPEHHALLRKLIDEVKDLEAKIDASRVTFKLRGVDNSRIEEARELTNAHFEAKKKQRYLADKSVQRYLPEDQQLESLKYFNALANSLYVVEVIDSQGRSQAAPGVDRMFAFLDKGPESQRRKFLEAVADLRVDSSQFESRLDDSFFPKS